MRASAIHTTTPPQLNAPHPCRRRQPGRSRVRTLKQRGRTNDLSGIHHAIAQAHVESSPPDDNSGVAHNVRRPSRVTPVGKRRPDNRRACRASQREPQPSAQSTPRPRKSRARSPNRTAPQHAMARDHRRGPPPPAHRRAGGQPKASRLTLNAPVPGVYYINGLLPVHPRERSTRSDPRPLPRTVAAIRAINSSLARPYALS